MQLSRVVRVFIANTTVGVVMYGSCVYRRYVLILPFTITATCIIY